MTIRNGALIGAALAALLHAGAALAWEDYPGFFGPGHAGIAIGDFDGNGTLEAAVTGYSVMGNTNGGTQLLAVLGADGAGKLGIRAVSTLPLPLNGPLVAAPRSGRADRLAVAANDGANGQILVLGGVPLRVLRTIEAPLVQHVNAIADVDADGKLDIVAIMGASPWSDGYPAILDYETGAIKWTGPNATTDVAVAQLDGDAALELILAGAPGRIVDGATHAVEWTYPSGFGAKVLTGRFGTDAAVGFATVPTWSGYLQIFRSQPYSPVSEINIGRNFSAAVARLTPNGPDQIVVGSGPSVSVYDPRTGQRLVGFSGDPIADAGNLAVGDIDGDGHAEVVYGAGLNSTGTDILYATDLVTSAVDYAQTDETGPYSALARDDLQGGGSDQIAYLTTGAESGSTGPNLYVLDAASGKRLRKRLNVLGTWSNVQPRIAVAQLDGDAQKEIIVGGNQFYSGMVAALDGSSLQDQWRVGGYNSLFDGVSIHALATIDANGDGTPDAVVATSAARVVVLNGRDGALLWQSVTLNGTTLPNLVAFSAAGSAPRVAVSRGTGLYVFDLVSHLLVASTKTAAGIVALWQWGEGDACRIAALDDAAVVTLHRCDTLALAGQRLMPAGSVFFRPLDAQWGRFIAASGAYLYEVKPDGSANPISAALGNQLGAGNLGIVRSGPDAQHFDVIIGSDYMVTRTRVGLDAMFANGFD